MTAPSRFAFDASVIVPVYMQWDLVPDLLDRLRHQTASADLFEIILVNNGTDAPPPLSLPVNARVIECSTPGSYAARNAGVAVSRGRWLAFTDADCRPEPTWLAALLAAGTGRTKQLLAGRVRMVTDSVRPSLAEAYELVRGIPQDRYVRHGYAATANLAVEREVLDAINGFDSTRLSGGDAEFCRRAGAAGFPITYIEAAVVEHPARATMMEVIRRTRRIKGGQVASGSALRRAAWLLRSLLPPVAAMGRALGNRVQPLRVRLAACVVYLVVWPVGIVEAVRLIVLRARPERR